MGLEKRHRAKLADLRAEHKQALDQESELGKNTATLNKKKGAELRQLQGRLEDLDSELQKRDRALHTLKAQLAAARAEVASERSSAQEAWRWVTWWAHWYRCVKYWGLTRATDALFWKKLNQTYAKAWLSTRQGDLVRALLSGDAQCSCLGYFLKLCCQELPKPTLREVLALESTY